MPNQMNDMVEYFWEQLRECLVALLLFWTSPLLEMTHQGMQIILHGYHAVLNDFLLDIYLFNIIYLFLDLKHATRLLWLSWMRLRILRKLVLLSSKLIWVPLLLWIFIHALKSLVPANCFNVFELWSVYFAQQ